MVRRNSRRVYERESRGRRLLEGCKVSTCPPLKGSVKVMILGWLEAGTAGFRFCELLIN